MSRVGRLLKAYERFVGLQWEEGLSDREKVWLCIYEPRDERRLGALLGEFGIVTDRSGHGWVNFPLEGRFERWMAAHKYRDSYLRQPKLLEASMKTFSEGLADELGRTLAQAPAGAVVAVTGAGALFGIASVSQLVERAASSIQMNGRLLVFFPGARAGSNYRLLDARDGWNYLAVPIESQEWTDAE